MGLHESSRGGGAGLFHHAAGPGSGGDGGWLSWRKGGGRMISETTRKSIHILMGGFALALRVLPWWGAALLAAVAVVSNATWIPRLGGGRLMRSGEEKSLLHSGVWLYSLSILILILLFRHRLEVVAAAWGILAFGDGAATL